MKSTSPGGGGDYFFFFFFLYGVANHSPTVPTMLLASGRVALLWQSESLPNNQNRMLFSAPRQLNLNNDLGSQPRALAFTNEMGLLLVTDHGLLYINRYSPSKYVHNAGGAEGNQEKKDKENLFTQLPVSPLKAPARVARIAASWAHALIITGFVLDASLQPSLLLIIHHSYRGGSTIERGVERLWPMWHW